MRWGMFDQTALESPVTCLKIRLKYHQDMYDNVTSPEKKEFYLKQINKFTEDIAKLEL